MRASAVGITLLGIGLLAATGCSSGAGGYASSKSNWHWPWSRRANAEAALAQGATPDAPGQPTLPSQMAQQPNAGYPPNYYSGAPGAEGYAQNPAVAGGYAAQAGYGAPAATPTASSGTGLYDTPAQGAAMTAQAGGYPLNPATGAPVGYGQPSATGYADPAAPPVSNDYYNSAYARADQGYGQPAGGYAAPAGGYAAPASGYGYAPVDPAQPPAAGYDVQHAAAMPPAAAPDMPQISSPPQQVADSRYAAPGAPGPAANEMPAIEYGAQGGDRYAPANPVAPAPTGAWQDPGASPYAGQYNEPQGFQPGNTGYTPGNNGFQPATAAPYHSPGGGYNANPNNPSAPRYRPGSTSDYQSPTRTSATGSAVAPANYEAAPGDTGSTVPAVYMPAASDAVNKF